MVESDEEKKVAEEIIENDNNEKEAVQEDNKGESRFSDDGMETEIEVTPENDRSAAKRKKTKSKNRDCSPKGQETVEIEKENQNEDVKEEKIDVEIPAYSDKKDSNEDLTKKEQYKRKIKNIKQNRCYLLYVIIFCKICIIIPIAIYACDVMLAVNVLDDYESALELVKDKKNLFNESNAPLLTVPENSYRHKHPKTVLGLVQMLSKERVKRQADINDTFQTSTKATNSSTASTAIFGGNQSTSTVLTSVTTIEPTLNNDSTSTFISALSTVAASPTMDDFLMVITNHTNQTEPPFKDDFCESEMYFIQEHEILNSKSKNEKSLDYDWFYSMTNLLFKYQQAFFFMFAVIGFFLYLLTTIGMRVDAILNEKWSSSLLIAFLLYSISMSLTAKVFALQSGSTGVRCFLCRMVSTCDDIDPWNLNTYFPTDINWNTVAFTSIILKMYDCFVIGIVTLKYILDFENNSSLVSFLKIFGWVVAFPLLIFTPTAGVIRYAVLPATIPDDNAAKLAFEIIFYFGVALWVCVIAVLPFFCKNRMCSNAEEFEDEEEYY